MRRLAIAVCLLLVVVTAGSAFAALSGSDKKRLQRDAGASLDKNVNDKERGEARQKFTDFFGKRKAKELADVEGLMEVLANGSRSIKRVNGDVEFEFELDGRKFPVVASVPRKYNPSGPSWPMIFAIPDKGTKAKDYLAKHWATKAVRDAYIIAVLDFDYSEVEEEVREVVKEEDDVKTIKKMVKKPFTWDHLSARAQWWWTLQGLLLDKLKVDPNRVILDGAGMGATGNLHVALGECWRFAGVIDRGGEGGDDAIANLATVRVLSLPYAMASEKAADATKQLKKVCGDNFTAGTNAPSWSGSGDGGKDLLNWLNGCVRSRYPLPYKWLYTKPVHQIGHWMFITARHDQTKPATFMMESDRKANLITIKTENVGEFNLYLNDLLVDLGEKFKVKINDADPVEYELERSADSLLEHASVELSAPGPWDPGCVFTASIEGIEVEAPAAEPAEDGDKKDDAAKDGEKKDGEKKDGEKKDGEKKDGEKKDGE